MRVISRALLAAGAVMAGSLTTQLAQAQVVFSDVGMNLEYEQTGPSTLTPYNGGTNAFFDARNFYTNPSDFDGGVLTFPGPASPQNFNVSGLLDCCGHFGMAYQTPFITPSDMATDFPIGITYTLTSTNSVTSASQSVDISFPTDIYAFSFPKLTPASFMALQNINPAAGLTLSFNSFVPDPSADGGQGFFSIFDFTSNSSVFNDSGFAPTTTSVFVPGGTFTAGDQYVFELIFDDFINGQDANGVNITARSDLRTRANFTVPTRTAVPEPATWTMLLLGIGLAGASLRRRARLARTVSA